jgi:hypothetical protein
MIEIDEPPDVLACSTCMRPLVHLWSPRTKRWVRFAAEPTDPRTLHVDDCRDRNPDIPSWRERNPYTHDPDAAERAHRGRALVDAALAEHSSEGESLDVAQHHV